MRKNLIQASEASYFADEQPTIENINAGSLQRIAAATEVMAQNWKQLTEDLNSANKRIAQLRENIIYRDKTISNLRGQITKLKNKAKIPACEIRQTRR